METSGMAVDLDLVPLRDSSLGPAEILTEVRIARDLGYTVHETVIPREALYIADELYQLRKLHEQADAQLATRSAECSEMLDRLLKVFDRFLKSFWSEFVPEVAAFQVKLISLGVLCEAFG